jgi:hypothetical protein
MYGFSKSVYGDLGGYKDKKSELIALKNFQSLMSILGKYLTSLPVMADMKPWSL